MIPTPNKADGKRHGSLQSAKNIKSIALIAYPFNLLRNEMDCFFFFIMLNDVMVKSYIAYSSWLNMHSKLHSRAIAVVRLKTESGKDLSSGFKFTNQPLNFFGRISINIPFCS